MYHGYKLSRLILTPPYRPTEELAFDNPVFGPEGARGFLADVVAEILGGQGVADERDSSYFRVDKADLGGWVLAIQGSGGSYGEPREVVNTRSHAARGSIGVDDAVLQHLTFLMVIPPSGTSGVLVSEVRGRSHLTAGLLRRLKNHLLDKGVAIRLESNIADEVAWNDFLDEDNVDVRSVELTQRNLSSDRTNFGSPKNVSRARLILDLSNDPDLKRGVFERIRDSRSTGKLAKLTSLVGIQMVDDDDFDEQKIVYVQDGRERSIRVTATWPSFTHDIDSAVVPDLGTILSAAQTDTANVLQVMGVDRQSGWWPTVDSLEAVEPATEPAPAAGEVEEA
jgi:hypothetical protein